MAEIKHGAVRCRCGNKLVDCECADCVHLRWTRVDECSKCAPAPMTTVPQVDAVLAGLG